MPSVGENLRRARLAQGLDLKQVALQTKISQRYLEAIEADDRASLPAGFFYKNWVRQYAAMLRLDVEAVSEEVDHIIAGDAPPALPGQERMKLPNEFRPAALQVPGGRLPWHRAVYSVVALVVVVLGCSALYAWWHNAQVHASPASTVADAKVVAPVQPPVTPQPQIQTPAPVQTTPASAVPVAPPVDREAVPVSPPVTDMVPSSTTSQQADRTAPAPAAALPGDVQIELAATQVTWISISPDGKQTFAGVLQPAEIKTVAAHESARIRFGNAGGVNVRLNGKAIGPIGPNGQVRTLVIDKSGFKILEPVPPPPPAPAVTQPSPTLDERSPRSAFNEQ